MCIEKGFQVVKVGCEGRVAKVFDFIEHWGVLWIYEVFSSNQNSTSILSRGAKLVIESDICGKCFKSDNEAEKWGVVCLQAVEV